MTPKKPNQFKDFTARVATMGDKQLLIIPKEKHYEIGSNPIFVRVHVEVLK